MFDKKSGESKNDPWAKILVQVRKLVFSIYDSLPVEKIHVILYYLGHFSPEQVIPGRKNSNK